MKRAILASMLLLATALGAQAAEPRYDGHSVTFNRDSRDPRVGWHTINGMRTCSQDCDNPEIPGSGYTCTYRTDGWRECVK